MPYIATDVPTGFSVTSKQSFSGDASTVAFTLTKAAASATDLEVFVDNVQQEPTTAYTVSSTTLTFTAAPATGTNNIYVVHRNGHADNGLLPPQDLGTTDYIFGDDLTLKSDAAVLGFGADTDTTLTHVADTGLLLNSTRQLQFGDSGTYIHQSADGVLDLVSDTELELNATEVEVNATTIDINGALAADGGAVFNEDSADVDFRVESNSNTHALFVDGGNDCIVIGGPDQVNGGDLSISTSAASAALSLLSRSTTDSHQCEIIMQKSSTDSGNFAATADGEALGSIKFRGVNTTTVSDIGAEIKVLQNGTASGTVPADMIFDTNETERFRLTSDGYHKFGNLPFAFVRGNDTNTRTIANNHYFFNTSESSQGAASLTGSSTLTHAGSNAITYTSSNGRFTVPVAGRYFVQGRFRYASSTDQAVQVAINTNGNHAAAYYILQCTEATSLHITCCVNLAASDYIQFQHVSGGDRDFYMADTHTGASIIYLG